MPQIQVWINNDDSTNTSKIISALNDAMRERKAQRLQAFAIFVSGAGKAIEPMLSGIEISTGAHDIGLAYLPPANRAVSAYKINLEPEVKNTVMFYRNKTIAATEVNLTADAKGLATLKADIAKITQ